MSRVLGFVFALAVAASAAHSEEDRSAYSKASARLTEQLNAVITGRVDLGTGAPPAKRDESQEERARSQRRAGR
jgi:hypothetical protein